MGNRFSSKRPDDTGLDYLFNVSTKQIKFKPQFPYLPNGTRPLTPRRSISNYNATIGYNCDFNAKYLVLECSKQVQPVSVRRYDC